MKTDWLLPTEAAACIEGWLQTSMAGIFEIPSGFCSARPLHEPKTALVRRAFCLYECYKNAECCATNGLKAYMEAEKRQANERLSAAAASPGKHPSGCDLEAARQLLHDLAIVRRRGHPGRHPSAALPIFVHSLQATLVQCNSAFIRDRKRNMRLAWFLIAADVDPSGVLPTRRPSDGRYSAAHMADRVRHILSAKNRDDLAGCYARIAAFLAFSASVAQDPQAVAVLAAATAEAAAMAASLDGRRKR